MALQLRSLSVHNQSAGAYGALATTVQLKGLNLDVAPAASKGSQGSRNLLYPTGLLCHVTTRLGQAQ